MTLQDEQSNNGSVRTEPDRYYTVELSSNAFKSRQGLYYELASSK